MLTLTSSSLVVLNVPPSAEWTGSGEIGQYEIKFLHEGSKWQLVPELIRLGILLVGEVLACYEPEVISDIVSDSSICACSSLFLAFLFFVSMSQTLPFLSTALTPAILLLVTKFVALEALDL